jgi:hypothetical protein
MKKIFIALVAFLMFFVSCGQNKQAKNANDTSSAGGTTASASDTTFKPAGINEQMVYSRAIEAVNWGMPAVNYDLMLQAATGIKGTYNQIIYWSRLPDWMNQTLTPNPDVIYLMPFINTKDVGPIVLEIPAADNGTLVGSIMDCWQMALEDIGPAGADKGEGGKYLILPPGFKGKVPSGYIPLPSDTYQGYALIRSVLKSGSEADIAAAVAYSKRIRLYPLSQAASPGQTTFIDAAGSVFDSTIQYDLRFFKSLDRMVQKDVWITRDKVMIDVLKTIGIEKGKPFNLDAGTRKILKKAILDARAWFNTRYDAVFIPPFNEGTHWALPASPELAAGIMSAYANPDSYPIDARGLAYSYAFFSAKHLGAGQYYLMTIKDKSGAPFNGSNTYRLNVPAKAPVRQYWSATVYDRATHAFIRGISRMGRSSQSPGIQKNADGSVDIYFGPQAPDRKQPNWIPTNAREGFEVLFRFYGPEKPLFDKTWKLQDIEQIK